MSTTQGLEIHRLALALVEAIERQDDIAIVYLLDQVPIDQITEFMSALAGMVGFAIACNPAAGLSGFATAYRDAIDITEAEAQALTTPDTPPPPPPPN